MHQSLSEFDAKVYRKQDVSKSVHKHSLPVHNSSPYVHFGAENEQENG